MSLTVAGCFSLGGCLPHPRHGAAPRRGPLAGADCVPCAYRCSRAGGASKPVAGLRRSGSIMRTLSSENMVHLHISGDALMRFGKPSC